MSCSLMLVPRLLSIFMTAQQAEVSQVSGSKTCVYVTVDSRGLSMIVKLACWLRGMAVQPA